MSQNIVVTGSGSGIGRAVAVRHARDHARLFLMDVNVKGMEETAKQCRALGSTVDIRSLDVSDENQVRSAMKDAATQMGSLDAICHCAAVMGEFAAFEDVTAEHLSRLFKINVGGTFFVIKHGLRIMKEQRKGVIICTASTNALVPCYGLSAYTATKHAVVGLIHSAAFENGKTGVRVCGVIPGNTNTAMIANCLEAAGQTAGPMGRVAEPEEIAASFAYLTSDEASYTNGTILVTNGGMAMT